MLNTEFVLDNIQICKICSKPSVLQTANSAHFQGSICYVPASRPGSPPHRSSISWHSFSCSLLPDPSVRASGKRRLSSNKQRHRPAAENVQQHQFVLKHQFWLVTGQQLQDSFQFQQSFLYLHYFCCYPPNRGLHSSDFCNHFYQGELCTSSVPGFVRAAPLHSRYILVDPVR